MVCQNFHVCFVTGREALAFVTFSKGSLNSKMVKKFSLKSFLDQDYLILLVGDTKGELSD